MFSRDETEKLNSAFVMVGHPVAGYPVRPYSLTSRPVAGYPVQPCSLALHLVWPGIRFIPTL